MLISSPSTIVTTLTLQTVSYSTNTSSSSTDQLHHAYIDYTGHRLVNNQNYKSTYTHRPAGAYKLQTLTEVSGKTPDLD